MTRSVVLTKRVIDAASPLPREYHLWDSKLRGLALRVHPSGTKTFILKRRTTAGRQVKLTIGRFGELTIDQARDRASEITTDLIKGLDPSQAKREARRMPRFDEFARRYLSEHCEVKNKPSSLRDNRSIVNKILIPRFGAKPVSEINHEDVVKLRNGLKDKPYRANRSIAVLRHMMNLAEEHGYRVRASNPCPKGTMLAERARNRFLTEEELVRLAQVLDAEEAVWKPLLPAKLEYLGTSKKQDGPSVMKKPAVAEAAYKLAVVNALRLLVLTGARLSEILTLRWDAIDMGRRLILLKDSKTGAKPIYLSDGAISVLQSVTPIKGNPYVIVGGKTGSHLVNLEKPWRRLRKLANLPDVRIHDLRHTYASYGVASGLGLPLVGALLGHRNAATTQRYAHLGASPTRKAAEQIGQSIGIAFRRRELPPASN